MSLTQEVDVVIIGGGPAGTALALTLCLYSKLTVAVIERTGYDNFRTGEHVSPSLLPLLDYLQVKEPFLADNHLPVYNVAAIWGHSSARSRPSLLNQMGEGYLLDRGEFDAMLAEQVVLKGGQLFLQTKCVEGEPLDGGGWRLLLEENEGEFFELEARYLVDATGRQARIAKRLGANSCVCDSLVGIGTILRFECAKPKIEEVLVESVPEGWWYSAWLPNGTLIAVLMTDVDIMREGKFHKEKQWIERLSQAPHTRQRARGGCLNYSVTVKPAQSHHLDRAIGEDWLAVGDAAAAFDPLSSLGIGHAMTSGCDAAIATIEYLNSQNRRLLDGYHNGLERNFETYLRMRQNYYNLEQRWSDRLFWKRRRQFTAIPAIAI